MKTTLIYQPTNPAIKAIDLQITTWLDQLDQSTCGGHDSKIAILESKPQPKAQLTPYRTFITEGMGDLLDISLKLEGFGLTCINKNDIYPTQGYDCIFVLK